LAEVDIFNHDVVSEGLGGNFFLDGSCSRQKVPELNRAGFAAVVADGDGFMAARVSGVVPAHFPQTPQAAEHLAFTTLAPLLRTGAHVLGDCENVVKAGNAAVDGDTIKGAYAPLYRSLRLTGGLELVRSFGWTKAHRDESEDMTVRDRWELRGNGQADREAKQAVTRQPEIAGVVQVAADARISRARGLLRLAAAVWQEWPPLPKVPLAPRAPANLASGGAVDAPGCGERRVLKHRFGPVFRPSPTCVRCWQARDVLGGRPLCSGVPAFAKPLVGNSRGHTLLVAAAAPPPSLLICVKCGKWSEQRLHGLKDICKGVPAENGRHNLKRLFEGKHPLRRARVELGQSVARVVAGALA